MKMNDGGRTSMLDLGHYSIALTWTGEDWIARNPELPGCIADGNTIGKALASLRISRKLWVESRLATGLEIPAPILEKV